MQRNISAYQQSHVRTSSRGDLLVALYDGAIRYAHAARQAIESKNFVAKGHAVSGAINIIQELLGTLHDHEAPALCQGLKDLYTYYVQRLQVAGMTMQTEPVDEVIGHLSDLRATWAQAVGLARQQGYKV